MKIECNNGPLMAGENDARTLTLTVEEAYASHEIRLAFLTPNGHRCLSPEIRVENGTAAYPLPACLLESSGKLLAQIIAENGEGQVAKSEVYAFSVERSIQCDAGDFTTAGFVTLGALDDAVKDLQADMASLSPAAFSGSWADLADTPTIPVIPQNVSAFANDAGYLTRHQSLAAYYTADETDAAITEAIEGRGSGSIYFGKCETAASTQIKVIDVGDDYAKAEGCVLYVWFKYRDTCAYPLMIKIGDDAPEHIHLDADASAYVCDTMRVWGSNEIVPITWRNNKWVLVHGTRATTTEYGMTKLNTSVSSTSTAMAATPSAVKQAYDKAASADTKATAAAAATAEKTGTFTPNFTPGSGNNLTVKQIGHVVYLSGLLVIDGTWGDISNNHLGDISGVDAPAGVPIIQVVSSADMNAYHIGVISAINGGNDTLYVGANVTGTDTAIAINGFYLTA